MEKIIRANGYCAAIVDSGVGVDIQYLGYHREFPDVPKTAKSYPALIPGWMPKPSKRELLKAGRK